MGRFARLLRPSVADGKLEIYLFGAAKGETIVLHLPDGRWGVVDCYSSSLDHPESNPACRLLRERQVRELEFLCLTHPHDDHFLGMSHLLKEFSVKSFWSIFPLDTHDFDLLKTYFDAEARSIDRPILKERAAELRTIFDSVMKPGCHTENVDMMKLLYPLPKDDGADFKIWGVAPSSMQTINYRKALLRQAEAWYFLRCVPQDQP